MSLDIAALDNICALATPKGLSALAIIRFSGPLSKNIFEKLFKKHHGEIKAQIAMHGLVLDADGQTIDDVMATLFLNKKSFTGEDSGEIYCHGNPIIVDQIIKRLCELGCRLARPGEFSMRALLNGKLDLTQAESIKELIHSPSKEAAIAALNVLGGALRKKTIGIENMLIELLAEIEARMDFPDEDLGSYNSSALQTKLKQGILDLELLLKGASFGIKLQEGLRLVLVGQPNAGKSTLLNCLAEEERAIVHSQAGTTRDVIEAEILLHGVKITLVDVAGLRENAEDIEQIGIEKAIKEIDRAHGLIWLDELSNPKPFCDPMILKLIKTSKAPVLKVLNKADLAQNYFKAEHILISAQEKIGIDELKVHLAKWLDLKLPKSEDIYITKARQREELEHALNALKAALDSLKMGLVDEVISSDLRVAGLAFERLFGVDLSESVLDKVFSEFCIGK